MNSLLGHGLVYKVETIVNGIVVDVSIEHNIMPQQAIDHVASLIRGGGATPISGWYLGIFEDNYVPDGAVTAADLQSIVGESTAYDETERLPWTNSYDGSGFIGNTGSPAEFTMNASKTIYGGFIVSNATKGGTSGIVLSLARFSTAKTVEPGSVLRVTAGLTLTPTSPL
tara:strand:- start:16 stop:525 length:510 start_codon:yes stop_codon:yes gene_type:complete